ncbi:MAG: carbohydrate kinase [Tannerella sp.]|jgi:fructokinase|nr:carbohydrate kinase [Tannerella sp.]
MRQVVGIGETILDILFKENQPFAAVPGGSVFNGMVSLSRLGIPVSFVSEAGHDRVGKLVTDFMASNGMTTDFIDFFSDGKSPVSLAFLNEVNDADYLFYTDYPRQRLNIKFPVIHQDDIVVFGSYYALNPLLRERVLEFLEYAKDRKALLYYDLNFRKAHMHEKIQIRPAVMDNYEYADIVRGSDEDFMNMYGNTDMESVYKDEVRYYCKQFVTTHGMEGVNLFTGSFQKHYDLPAVIDPVSTIGAGDNFNAGIVYGLIKYGVRRDDLANLSDLVWEKIISCGMELAKEVCRDHLNYVSHEFATKYKNV